MSNRLIKFADSAGENSLATEERKIIRNALRGLDDLDNNPSITPMGNLNGDVHHFQFRISSFLLIIEHHKLDDSIHVITIEKIEKGIS